jgi:uncharacterized metal-binding protein
MFRAKVWGPIAVVSSVGLAWHSLDIIARRPDLRPWVIFLLLLGLVAVSSTCYLVAARVERIVKSELSTRSLHDADILAFDRVERKRQ